MTVHLTQPPDAQLDHDDRTRLVLAAAHRWARTTGWQRTYRGWRNNDRGLGVAWDHDEVSVWRRHPRLDRWPSWPVTYRVFTVRQAIDVLCAVDVLPNHLSSAYKAGQQEARVRDWITVEMRP